MYSYILPELFIFFLFLESNIESMTRATLMNYLSNYHSPERMVVAGVGVDHEELVETAQVSDFHISIV